MIRIGVVNIDVSHPLAFSEYLMKGSRARYVAVYNDGFRENDEVDAFIRKFNVEKRCNTVEELADIVDIGFIQGCNWDKHLGYALPFIERHKPVFIDKPIVGNMSDCRKLESLWKDGAVILGSSSLRYAEEVVGFLKMPSEEKGQVLNIFGTAGVDEYNYAIHIVEALGGLIGNGAVSNKFAGRSESGGKTCETYYIKFQNGITAVYNTFQGTWQPFEMVIMTTKSTFRFRVDTSKIYGALLDRICDYMETGKSSLASVPDLIESVKIMFAGKLSRENGGKEVQLKDVPSDYSGFDGYQFEKAYADAASKIYL